MDRYDLICVGTGFASAFFLHGWLRRAKPSARVLVLERGPRRSHEAVIAERRELPSAGDRDYRRIDRKPWRFAAMFGGTSNLWFGNTPRMLPEDFELRTRYGVGWDWPLGYDDLEPHYAEAEALMGVAGPTRSPFARSGPYPQPAHALSLPEQRLQTRHGDDFFACPSARASVAGDRARCCGNDVCNICPVDAKFTIGNGMAGVFADPRVELRLGAVAQTVEHGDGVATGVTWIDPAGVTAQARGEQIALGANALFNAHILLRSGLDDGVAGRYLHEQIGVTAVIHLDGLDNFQGGTSCTGHHYRYARGDRRRERAACLLETYSAVRLRLSPGRWRQAMQVTGVFEVLPESGSEVRLDPGDPRRPMTRHVAPSAYTTRAIEGFAGDLERMLDGLPIDDILIAKPRDSEGHILGTARMGRDPATSVVDDGQRHHRLRNLLVLGGSSFPSGAPANPTLTIAALSLRSAALLGSP